jgi:DNA-binding response OmpR family regulator
VTKPFNIKSSKRASGALRRYALLSQSSGGIVHTVGQSLLTRKSGRPNATVRGGATAKEFDVIELLVKNPDRVFSRENLLNIVWGYEYQGDIRTVDVHVRRLREKLENNPAEPERIMTKWGVGYYIKG